jgi:hypothetical protein
VTIESIRTIVASTLDWEQAHATFDAAVAGLAADLRGRRPENLPYSVWELVEHIRIAQEDLADYMERADHPTVKWPDDYWPATPAPPSDAAWSASLTAVRRDGGRLKALTMSPDIDLASPIPWGEGRTYLRTILLAVDHTAYHVGQIILIRKLLGVWP